MADWTYTPEFPVEINRMGPRTLVTTFEDGTEVRREKTTNEIIEFVHNYFVNQTNMDAMLDFFETKNLDTTFTIKSYEAEEAGWPTTAEATVRFAEAPRYRWVLPNWFSVTIRFRKVL